MDIKYLDTFDVDDLDEWGAIYKTLTTSPYIDKISLCHVKISDISRIANALSNRVQNLAWIMELDQGTQRQYRYTANETAKLLVEIFNNPKDETEKLSEEFGELMISIGSSRALEKLLSHFIIPIAELWKPRIKQNEGFDFHTVCDKKLINFGEAKYSGNKNPHYDSSDQINDFFDQEKQYRDRTYLRDFVDGETLKNLDNEKFGVVIAFSINSVNPILVFKNAIKKIDTLATLNNASHIYIVGISHEC